MPNKPEAYRSLVTKSQTFLTVQPKQFYISSSLFSISTRLPPKQASHPFFLSHLMKEQSWPLPLQRTFCFHDGAFESKTGVSFPHRKSQSHAILKLPYCHPKVLPFRSLRPSSPSLDLIGFPIGFLLIISQPQENFISS